MAYKITIIITIFLLIFFAVVARAEELPVGYSSLSISKNIPQGGEARLDVPVGLYCGTGCAKMTNPYPSGTVVKITIAASPGYAFSGWSGDCPGAAPICAVTMNSAKNVVANFNLVSSSTSSAFAPPSAPPPARADIPKQSDADVFPDVPSNRLPQQPAPDVRKLNIFTIIAIGAPVFFILLFVLSWLWKSRRYL